MSRTSLRMAALAALVVAGACDDGATDPAVDDTVVNEDVALLAADAVQEDLDVMNATLAAAGPALAAAQGGIFDFARTRTVTFYDADGVEQDAFDDLTTASINTTLVLEGSRSRDRVEFTFSRTRDMWITGLEGEETERTWNGTGQDDRSRVRLDDGAVTRSYTFDGSLLVEDVVVGVPRAENPWPLSGTITRELTIDIVDGIRGTRTVSRTVVVTFNGTSLVTLTVNGESFEFDLASRDRDRVRRRDRQS